MTQRALAPLFLSLSFVCLGLACSDDGTSSTSDETETSGDGDGDPAGDGDGDDPTDSGDGDGDPTDSGDGDGDDPTDSGDGDGDPPAGCQVWEIEYDLTGSVFEISDTPFNAGNQANTVAEPYDQGDHVGPGSFVVRWADVDGEPGGTAWMVSYNMSLNFVVNGPTTITTELQNDAGPNECGITAGPLVENSVEWEPLGIPDHTSVGSITCDGFLCGVAGFEDGVPSPINDMGMAPLAAFTFSADRTTFDIDGPIIVQQDDNSTTTWLYTGTEASRELVDAPECLCD